MVQYGFDEQGARRVVDAVREVENRKRPRPLTLPPRVSSGSAMHWVRAINSAAETIPPLSIARIVIGAVHDGIYHLGAAKPSSWFGNSYGLTTRRPIAVGKKLGLIVEVGFVTYDDGDGTPVVGEGWGPKPDQWTIAKGFPGCTILGVYDTSNKIALVSLD